MEIIKAGTNYDFVGQLRYALVFSAVLLTVAVGTLIIRGGPNYGIDFAGGTMVQIKFRTKPAIDGVRQALVDAGLGDVTIQDFGAAADGGEEILVRTPISAETQGDQASRILSRLQEKFGAEEVELQRSESVGPRVGSELRLRGILAVLFATIMMGAYIWFRFELRFGIGAAVALFHDVLITLGALTLMGYELDLTIVAALLTVVGFSVNDTVIVSDRIRENMAKTRRDSLATTINRSVNETLSRTILTTLTAFLVLLALFFLGGNVINGFAFTLLVGFAIGTYSSIFVATPVVHWFEPSSSPARGR